ncbi:MAG: enoyl-CoA hydratase/isomerase family protein [Burkholderiaceae bacterium]|nr:enoyl-CoA hydratase/isomerase family protein [Burkholderiaceae bacterium]
MDYRTIEFSVDEGVALLTLNRPSRRNAVDLQMRGEIPDAIARVRADHSIRVLILTGAGGHFCAGGDLASMQGAIADAAAGRDRLHANIGWVEELVMLDRPVIAAVDGHAAGAGCNLALAADFILATPEARFTQSFLRVGLVPDFAGMYLLPRIVGLQRAKELVFSARALAADEAMELGIVHSIHPAGQLLDAARSMAKGFCQAAPAALGLAKQSLNRSFNLDLRTALEFEAAAQGICFNTEWHREAVRRFLAKEPSQFTGLGAARRES